MKNVSIPLLFAITSVLLIGIGCSSPTSDDGEGSTVLINGLVVDGSETPIENAIVRITDTSPERSTTTDSVGMYEFEITVDSSQTFTIEARKEGHPSKTEDILAIPDRDIEMPDFKLSEDDTTDGGDGDNGDDTPPEDSEGSAYISLEEVSENEIRVDGAGGIETTDFTFVVTDSAGTPVSNTKAQYVRFEILEGPNGGESIYPDSVLTQNGEATATLKSGNAAGVVKIQASFMREEETQAKTTVTNTSKSEILPNKNTGNSIPTEGNNNSTTLNKTASTGSTPTTQETITHNSKPIQVVIHGGAPSADHFNISTDSKNIPAADAEETAINVDLGDEYGNDVPEGTAVYFSTNTGTINGSANTDENGIASSNLEPAGTGITTVTVETINKDDQTISKDIDILFSGSPELSDLPSTIDLENLDSETVDFTVADENGHPLAEGTTISVSVDNDDLSLDGDTDVTLSDDTENGNGTTDFSFTLSKDSNANIYENATITVAVDGPNGTKEEEITLTAPDAPEINAGSITLESISEKEIGVVSTGQTEQTDLTFQVKDSTGQKLNSDNTIDVDFKLGTAPGGEEGLSPKVGTTDDNGQVTTTLTSGTEAGVAQVVAEIATPNGTIKSNPVQVVIHSGLPAEKNFSLAASSNHVPANSREDVSFTALAGDIHGNVVPEGTSIYFSTDGGIIDGAAETNAEGEASVNLKATDEYPNDGNVTVTAETGNDDEQNIEATATIIFAEEPELSVSPTTLDLTNFNSETFTYTAQDINGNPLTEGTNVSVSVDNNNLSLNGDTDITIPDAVNSGPDVTEFEFTLSNPSGEPIYEDATITVAVDGPNGTKEEEITLTAPDAPEITPGHVTLAEGGVDHNEIGVINTGQREQTDLTFQVKDSTGQSLDLDNQTEVRFSLGASPGGEEDVYPKTVTTDENGQATTTLTSGTEAGVTQVLAEITTKDGTTVTSQPVQVAIHAGLPDQDHFTVKSSRSNVFVAGEETPKIDITAYTGDRYGNIVPEGTTIYFTTDGGYISGSGETDSQGEVTATLTAANPIPGDGIATVTAETADDNNATITTDTEVIFAGSPSISLDPETFTIADDDKQDFTYEVLDDNNNPMPVGTTIEVEAIGGDFELEDPNDGEVTIGSGGDTEFDFTVIDADPGNVTDDTFYITITATIPPTGDDGSETVIKRTFTGTKQKTR